MFEDLGVLELTISTFLGFLSALIVEYVIVRVKESTDSNDALIGIYEELESIVDTILSLKETSYHLDPLETPVWDSLVYGGDIPNLKLQKEIILAYRYIDRLNNWENVRTNSFFTTHSSNSMLDKEVAKNRKEVLDMVDKVLKDLDAVIKR